MNTLASNIPKLYLLKISRWMMLFMPVIYLYFTENGLSMKEIMLLQAIFSISVAILEVPSGYLSDVMGRKKTLIISSLIGLAGFCIFAFANGFVTFAIAELLLGISASLASGTDSALLYDSLAAMGKEKEYLNHEGRIGASGNFAEGIAALIGGQLAFYGLRYPYYGQVFIAFVGVIVAFTLIEPQRAKSLAKASWKEIGEVVSWTFKEQKILRSYIFLYSVIGFTTLTTAWFAQPYFKFLDMPLAWYGYIWAALQFTVGIFSWFVEPILRSFSRQFLAIAFVGVLVASLLALGNINALWGISFVFVIYIVRGLAAPFFKSIIIDLAHPSFKATILSLNGLVVRLLFSSTSPFLGWLMDLYNIQYALIASGLILLISGTIVLLQLKFVKGFD